MISILFENDVNMYGTQAILQLMAVTVPFENDVNMYGAQAKLGMIIFQS